MPAVWEMRNPPDQRMTEEGFPQHQPSMSCMKIRARFWLGQIGAHELRSGRRLSWSSLVYGVALGRIATRSSATRWVSRFEVIERRILLSGNGLINQATGQPNPAAFGGIDGFPVHTFAVTSVPQDPSNTGQVKTATITVDGYVQGPETSNDFTSTHEHLEIDVSVNGGGSPDRRGLAGYVSTWPSRLSS